MRNVFIVILLALFFGCTGTNKKKADNSMSVSFELGQKNINKGVIVAYTNDPDSLWLNPDWIATVKNKMEGLSSTYSTVLLFNGKENMPNVASTGMDFSADYDKYMVCGYWIFPNGNKKFCYGGNKSDGNFKICE